MTKININQLRRIIALILVVVMATPYITTEGAEWLEDLPEIPSLGVEYDPAATDAYILSTIPGEFHTEYGNVPNIYQDAREREEIEFKWLLFSDKTYSELTESERIISFNQLEIACEEIESTKDLLAEMERDGYTFADSVELLRIISTELFDYDEARIIYENIPRYEERISELLYFEFIIQELETALQRNIEFETASPGALRIEPALISSEITLSGRTPEINAIINPAIEIRERVTDLTEANNLYRINKAREMFLSGRSVFEIEEDFSEILNLEQQMHVEFQTVTGAALEMDFNSANLDAAAFGFTPASATHTNIIENPFNLRFNANESVILNTGAVEFRQNILNLPGRGGFGLNLDLVYNSFNTNHAARARPNSPVHGWAFDLPYLLLSVPFQPSSGVLYVPGRGTFTLIGTTTIVGRNSRDMRLESWGFNMYYGNIWANRILIFDDGTRYYFNNELIAGMVDRFGNTIRFQYGNVVGSFPQLSRIIDSNGRDINFTNQVVGNNSRNRIITITSRGRHVYH